MSDALTIRRKRLLYLASYRGFKEADLLLGGFAKAHLSEMTENELDQFENLANQNDRELYAWATSAAPAPQDVQGSVLDMLKSFKISQK